MPDKNGYLTKKEIKGLKLSFSNMNKKDWKEFDKAYRQGELDMDMKLGL